MFTFKVDENITLELPLPHHAAEIASVVQANLRRLRPWVPWAAGEYTIDSAEIFINQTLKDFSENGSFALLIRFDDKLAGAIGFHNLDKVNRSAHIGYWIAKDFEARGIITSCCRVLIDYLFQTQELNRVQINCNVENSRSRAIPERLGFSLEGIHRQVEWLNGKFVDWAVYAMLRSEWSKPPA